MSRKTLLLLRHAKSSWDEPALDDFDRPLAQRGRKAAPAMGRVLSGRGWLPDAALVSAAVRTRQTWDLAAAELGGEIPAMFERSIYEAPASRILDAVRRMPEEIGTLVVVGHNPGLEELSRMLASPDSDRIALARLTEKFPTGALARFNCDGKWRDLSSARLEDFVRPRDLD